jgi:hypothetical protein
MSVSAEDEFLAAVRTALPADESALAAILHRFTAARLAGAAAGCERSDLHAFLRECWEVLDGLAREVNVVMHRLFPAARLYPPLEMTRQCTFYVVRKNLAEHPDTAGHPLSRLLWEETRGRPAPAYERLSFLYNLSLFAPLPLPDGELPGTDDVPDAVRPLTKPGHVPRAPLAAGTAEILAWLDSFTARVYGQLAQALAQK